MDVDSNLLPTYVSRPMDTVFYDARPMTDNFCFIFLTTDDTHEIMMTHSAHLLTFERIWDFVLDTTYSDCLDLWHLVPRV